MLLILILYLVLMAFSGLVLYSTVVVGKWGE